MGRNKDHRKRLGLNMMQASNAHLGDTYKPPDPEHSLLGDISAALLVCDDSGSLGYANSQAGGLLGVDARLVVGRKISSLFRLEAPGGDLLAEDRISHLYRREVMDEAVDDCVLVRADGVQVQLNCELAAIGHGAILIVLRPVESRGDHGSLAYQASHDALTGLPNRAYLQERLGSLHSSAEAKQSAYSLLLLDLDHFKIVNDRFGHATGDQVLAQVGRRIAHNVRGLDMIGRWGGEEFLCLLPDVSRPSAEEIAERIRSGLEAQPVEFQGRQIRVTSSIGVATYPDDGRHPDALLAKADAALYEAKRSGRNRIQSVTRAAGNVFALAHIIEKSLREDRVLPAFQSVVDLMSGEVRGAEALARIQLDDRQVMEAAFFIPAAEQLHLVHQIDHRVIQSALMYCNAQQLNDGSMAAMFVNFSADFLRHPDLVEDILETVKQQCAFRGERFEDTKPLVIEITEREFMEDLEEAKDILQPFLDMGLRIAIDDFGDGFSSLNYLLELPVSFIKLEGSLVRRVTRERRVRTVLHGVQELAADLGVTTVAEGIEDEETLDRLRAIGVDWGQGFYFSRPSFDL
jgi:diguanylate cyclase (GGDEF)-like protein